MNIMKANFGISNKSAALIGGGLAIAGLILLLADKAPKSTAVAEGSATTSGVTTQVVAGATVGRKVTFSVSPRLGDGGSTNR